MPIGIVGVLVNKPTNAAEGAADVGAHSASRPDVP
jgi:hypothetical protein